MLPNRGLHSDAPRLAELTDVDAAALKASNAGIELAPLVRYEVARPPREEVLQRSAGKKSAGATAGLTPL